MGFSGVEIKEQDPHHDDEQMNFIRKCSSQRLETGTTASARAQASYMGQLGPRSVLLGSRNLAKFKSGLKVLFLIALSLTEQNQGSTRVVSSIQ
jgi:hypothetical protein